MSRVSFTRLLQKEWSIFFRDRTNKAVLAVFALCLAIAAWNGVRNAKLSENMTIAAIEADAKAFDKKISLLEQINAGEAEPGRWNDPRKAHQGILHPKRPLIPWPAEMGFLSAESDPLTPALMEVGMATRHTNPDPVFEDPSQRQDGPFDLVFVVVWLAPLIIILLSYDVLARDRELGQARILASQNVTLRQIVLARLAVRFVNVALVTISIVAAAFVLSPDTGPANLAGAAVWILGLVLFLGFWVSLSALINAGSRNAATAGQTLLAIWAGLTLVVPLVIGVGAKLVSPPIDRFETILAYRALSNKLNQHRDEITNEFFSTTSIDASREQLSDEYAEYFVTVFYPMQLAFDEQYRTIGASIERRRIEQIRTLRIGAFASPALAMKLLSDDLAGSAPERRLWFLRSVDTFQNQWRTTFNKKITEVLTMTVEDYENKPEFISQPEAFWARWTRMIVLLVALVLPVGLITLLSWRALNQAKP